MYDKIEKQFWCLILGVPMLELVLWLSGENHTFTDNWSWIRFVITYLIIGNITWFIISTINSFLRKK